MPLKPITTESANRICALVIGRPGIGKTSLIRTVVNDGPTLVLSAEGGLLSVRDLVTSGQVEGFEISNLADFKEAYTLISTDPQIKERYRWIFIDSLTEIAAKCEEAIKAKVSGWEMWGQYNDTMKFLVKGFRDLFDFNVVFTALETVEKDTNNVRFVAPSMAGKGFKELLPSYFDEVLYMSTAMDGDGKEARVLYTSPFQNYPAKDRSGKLDPVEWPDLGAIKNKILA